MNKRGNGLLKGLPLWGERIGLIGVIIGGIVGGITVYEKWFAPRAEVLSIVPVAVRTQDSWPGREKVDVYGISLVVRLRSRSRAVSITAIDAIGKIYLLPREFYAVPQRKQEFWRRKPYYRIHWTAWPEGSQGPIRLPPNEETYVRFTFMEPNSFVGMAMSGSMDPYVGYEDIGQDATRSTEAPEWYHFFKQSVRGEKDLIPSDIREEFRDGTAKLQLRAGTRTTTIKPDAIGAFQLVSKHDWDNKTPQELFMGYTH